MRDMVGEKFGYLTVLGGKYSTKIKEKTRTFIKVRCDCGEEKEVRLDQLKSGSPKSCGCKTGQLISKNVSSHGLSYTPEYKVYYSMMERCNNPNDKRYAAYGGSGIKVCDRWQKSFLNFYEDMGKRTTPQHTIDRIDGSKGYSKDNCRWATFKEQNRNLSSNRIIKYKGKEMCMVEWSEHLDVPYWKLNVRINQRGLTPIEAIERAIKERDN